MATNRHNHLQLPELELDHIEPMNGQHNEAMHLGQKLLLHHGHDAALRIGPSDYGSRAVRLNDVPSSSRAAQYPSYRVGNIGASHPSLVHFPGSSSSCLSEPPGNYQHRSEEIIAPVSSRLENRRAAVKRKNPIVQPVDGISMDGYYVGSSSNTQMSNYEQPNPATLTEPLTQVPLSIGQSGWDGQQLFQQEGFQRNVRARLNHHTSLEPRTSSTHTANDIYLPPLQLTASASPSTLVARNQTPISVAARTAPSGAPGITSRTSIERPYYPAVGSSNSSVAVVPSVNGLSGNATFANGDYAPRTINPVYSHPALAGASGSGAGSRAVPHETIIRSCPPGFSATSSASLRIPPGFSAISATSSTSLQIPPGFSAASSTSLRIPPGLTAVSSASLRTGQPLPTRSAAPARNARHVAIGHANNRSHRRVRSSYYAAFHPLMTEAQRLMLDHLVFYEQREAADPHRDMRLDVDNMSYEELLALGESIGNVNTGLADDKISGCVREVVCCSSDPSQNDEDDGTCAICLDDYKDKDLLGTLKCSHDFHADCIKKWLQVKNSCPVCKAAAA